MNNEEAYRVLGSTTLMLPRPVMEAIQVAMVALRVPPATGAAAMREACAAECDALQHDFKIEADDAQRKGLFNQENDYAMRSYGARACAAAIRALPAPEVPEAVREWCRYMDSSQLGTNTVPAHALRDWIRKEYAA